MKKFRFDFSIDVWIQCLEIEAKNYESAKKKLLEMSLYEVCEEGCIKDYDYKNIDCEEVEEN